MDVHNNVILVSYYINIIFKPILMVWIDDLLLYSIPFVICMGIYAFVIIWNNNIAYFLNGINEINWQLITALLGGIINIPLSIYFAKSLQLGSTGVVLYSIVSLSLSAIAGPLQIFSLLKSKLKYEIL